MPLIVYKLGGSLLTLSNLPRRLEAILRKQLPASPQRDVPLERVVLTGGGRAADVVRSWDRSHKLPAERAHVLALSAMALNARFVNGILENSELVATRNHLRKICDRGKVAVLDPPPALDAVERRSGDRLPRSWDVTSDSIAAFLAIHWRAAALVMIKSTPRPSGLSLAAAARRGFVDKYFPQLAERVPVVAWTNLRSKNPLIERWL